MSCLRLAFLATVGLLSAALPGCMKPVASAGPAPLVIPVTAVNAAPVAPSASVDPPHPTEDPDGHLVGDRVLVESHGSWLPATLVERRGERWLVRYDERQGARGDGFEELVERDRIRPRVERIDDDSAPIDVDP